jgi:hypothetical protein
MKEETAEFARRQQVLQTAVFSVERLALSDQTIQEITRSGIGLVRALRLIAWIVLVST